MIRINTKLIEKFNPCKDRFDNWKASYNAFDNDILEFLYLENISATDKIWVSVRLLPRELLEYFAIDRAVNAAVYSYEADVIYAPASAYAAAYAADYAATAAYEACAAYYDDDATTPAVYAACAASYAVAAIYAYAPSAAAEKERENQVDCLIYLIEQYRAEK